MRERNITKGLHKHMKILYGVQGTGNGHLTRSRIMAKEFKKAGIEVTYLFSGREESDYFDMEPFGENVIFKKGLTFSISNGKVDILQTITKNDFCQLLRDIDHLNLSQYDFVISDYEPITSWAARIQDKLCYGLGHQYAFNFDIPKSHTNFVTSFIMKWFAPADVGIGLHWQHFDQPILPPIIEQLAPLHLDEKKIIVYIAFEDLEKMVTIFSNFPEYNFRIYDKRGETKVTSDNVSIMPISKDDFLYDLRSCYGVICNAGFELASESIHLGKKLLVKPVEGQMEQHSNALALQKLGYGMAVDKLSIEVIDKWLSSNNDFKSTRFPNVAKHVIRWLTSTKNEGCHTIRELSNKLWDIE